jgi:hypothetical protein
MTELKPGMRIKANDPRQAARLLTIVRVEGRFVYATGRAGIESRIQACRVYTDGKQRRTGFSLVGGRLEPALVHLLVTTRHPETYMLVNEADGTRWRGGPDGSWHRDDELGAPAASTSQRGPDGSPFGLST